MIFLKFLPVLLRNELKNKHNLIQAVFLHGALSAFVLSNRAKEQNINALNTITATEYRITLLLIFFIRDITTTSLQLESNPCPWIQVSAGPPP